MTTADDARWTLAQGGDADQAGLRSNTLARLLTRSRSVVVPSPSKVQKHLPDESLTRTRKYARVWYPV